MNKIWGDVPIHPLSPRLRAVVEQLVGADLDAVTQRTTAMIRAAISDYTLSSDPSLPDELRGSVRLHARLWYEALLSTQYPSEEALSVGHALARRRVHQGVSLAGLLRAFRFGALGFWLPMLEASGDDPELHRELLFKVSPYLLHHFDAIAQGIAQVYNAEQLQQERWRERARHELWTVISTRPDDMATFRRYTEALGIDPAAPICALALATTSPSSEKLEGMVDLMMGQVARMTGIGRETFLRTVHHGQVLLWLPAIHGELLVDHNRRMGMKARDILRQIEEVTAVGVGLPAQGPHGWHVSAEQAFKALDVCAPDRDRGVVCYSDIVLDDSVAGTENVKRFFDSLIERLAVEPQLLETLQTWFELKQHRKAVAGALNVHPNTLDHRLERIEQLLGARLSEMSWMAKLHTALRLSRSTGPKSTIA